MSLPQAISTPNTHDGYARKPVTVRIPEDSSITFDSLSKLRDFFARRSDVLNKDKILSSIENFFSADGAHGEIIQGELTRKQRKAARNLGFEVRYKPVRTLEI